MRAVIYCRHAVVSQASPDRGASAQELTCRDYCVQRGHTVVAVVTDDGVSGLSDARPNLEAWLAANREAADVVVISTFDRLSRDTKACTFWQRRLQDAGLSIEVATMPGVVV